MPLGFDFDMALETTFFATATAAPKADDLRSEEWYRARCWHCIRTSSVSCHNGFVVREARSKEEVIVVLVAHETGAPDRSLSSISSRFFRYKTQLACVFYIPVMVRNMGVSWSNERECSGSVVVVVVW